MRQIVKKRNCYHESTLTIRPRFFYRYGIVIVSLWYRYGILMVSWIR